MRWVIVLGLAGVLGCRGAGESVSSGTGTGTGTWVGASPSVSPSASASASASEAAVAPIPPDPIFTRLPVPGHPDAVVSLPNGATSPRPVIVAIHGMGDVPEWNCDVWRHISSASGWVVCPRGKRDPSSPPQYDTFTHPGGEPLRAHVAAALAALAERWPGYVDVDRPILVGFSLGASEIVALAANEPARFPRIAMVEGGAGAWSADRFKAFTEGGGVRAIFGCGQPGCVGEAKWTAARFEKAGVGAREYFVNVGHAYDRPLQDAIKKDWAWFVEGDPRWSTAPE